MSCGGILSPVMSIAGAGLLQNVGLAPSSALTSSLSSFTSVPAVSQFSNILGSAASALSPGTFQSLATLGAGSLPGLTNVIPSDLTSSLSLLAPGGVSATGLSGIIGDVATGIMGNGDISKFTQVFNSAVGYASQATQFINSSLNIDSISNTFGIDTGGMNNLITGGFNQVSTSFLALGQDLGNLGSLVSLNNLPNLGDPSSLLQQLGSVAGTELPAINQVLSAAGVPSSAVNSLAQGFNDISASTQKNLYNAFTTVTGSELEQVKSVLGVTTPGITNMAQLLDPKRILPNSFQTLQMPTPNGLQPIYNTAGAINTGIERFLQDPNAPEYTGDDPIVRARLGLPPRPSAGVATA
jgi:hypothetical protein